MDVFDISCLIS